MLACTKPGEKVLIHNDAHQSHLNAVKLAGCTPVYYEIPKIENWGIYGKTTSNLIEPFLKSNNISALIVTSPTYEGIVSDIKELKKICSEYNVRLIVDEAHGALYPFCDKLPESAVKIADFTVQSLHKTAGGLNPTALLHSNCEINPKDALAMINTTSPSYPLLATIEANINFLNSRRFKKYMQSIISSIQDIKNQCLNVEFFGDDITKINIKKENLTGYELSAKLYSEFCIEDERTNDKSTMLLCGIGTDLKKLERFKKALRKL